MSDMKVLACTSCGIKSEAVKHAKVSSFRCPPCAKERRTFVAARAQSRYKNKLKKEGKPYPTTVYTRTCEMCSTPFISRHKLTKFCSQKCVNTSVRKTRIKNRVSPCVDCGTGVTVHWSHRADQVRCIDHKKVHTVKMRNRRNSSRRTRNNVAIGEGPYSDYVVVGPEWCSAHGKYGWRVTVKHRGSSRKREMSLAHYSLSVKENRKVQDKEDLTFLDGDIDNCDHTNLKLGILKEEIKCQII